MTRKLWIVVLAFALSGATLSAQTKESVKAQKARQLLTLLKAGEMGLQIVDSMLGSLKSAMPNVPEDFWAGFRRQIKASDLLDLVVPVYEKNLDEADLDELIRFYSSPAGKHFIERQPIILQESMAVGQQWGEQLAERAIEALKAKGYAPKT